MAYPAAGDDAASTMSPVAYGAIKPPTAMTARNAHSARHLPRWADLRDRGVEQREHGRGESVANGHHQDRDDRRADRRQGDEHGATDQHATEGTTTRTLRADEPAEIIRSPTIEDTSISTSPTIDGSANIDPACTRL